MVLLVDCTSLKIGGGVQVGLSFLESLSQENSLQAVVIATPQIDRQLSKNAKLAFENYRVIANSGKLHLSKTMKAIEEEYRPDLVFTVFGPSYWRSKAPNLQGFALGLMFYPEVQDYLNYSFFKKTRIRIMYFIKQYLLKKNADYYVVETDVVKNNLKNLLNLDSNRIFVIENSYNPYFEEYFNRNVNVKILEDEFNFLVPSSYYPHKNLEILANVVDLLYIKNFKNIYFNFMIEDKYFEALSRLVVNENARYMLKNFGPITSSNLPKCYADCDAVILPTLAESSTSAYPESFISKKPLLTSDRDFSRGLCGEAALFFDPLDAEDILNKVITIYQDEKLRVAIVEKGVEQLSRVYISAEEKWEKQKNLILSLINS